jgi:DNA-binding Lrp family transcriptional regulator
MLDKKDLAIILALIQKPMATDPEIKEMIETNPTTNMEISIPTINRRIRSLTEARIVQGALPVISYQRLGMKLHSFLLQVNPEKWGKNTNLLKTFFAAHPYTLFHNEVFGAINGIFCQFNLPDEEEALGFLTESFDYFITENIIIDFIHLPNKYKSVGYNANLERWDAQTNQWYIDFDRITEQLRQNQTTKRPVELDQESILDEIQMLDLIILREMTRNSRRSQSDILDFAKNHEPLHLYDNYFSDSSQPASKQSFSRRFNFLLESGIVSDFELAYSRLHFGEFNQALYIGKFEENSIGNLIDCIESDLIPFPCRLSFTPDDFIFWVNFPPAEIIHFPNIMMDYFQDVKVFFLGRQPAGYLFYHENFDPESKSWKMSHQWMVDQPLEAVKNTES